MGIFESITETIGNTPLIRLNNLIKKYDLAATITAKVESFNPGGSIKDRIAAAMLDDAEKKGLIDKDSVIIEPTSGNTGIGLAMVAAAKGYKIIFTMPETMSIERQLLLKAYGAEIVLTEGALGMKGAVEKANQLAFCTAKSFIPSQFTNPANPTAHYNSTAREIWCDTDGKIDILVAGIGTGGTISGTGKYLKEKNANLKVIAVEPFDSPLLSENRTGSHSIQGIGANFIPDVLDTSVYDEIVKVKTDEAFLFAKELAREEGILAGISSGAALFAAVQTARKKENNGKLIVAVLPDTGTRYLSTDLFK